MRSLISRNPSFKYLSNSDLKNQDGVSWDLGRTSAGTVAKLRRDDQFPLLSLTHANLMVKMILMPTIDFDENSPIPDPIP